MSSIRVVAERDPSIRETFKESTEKPISQMKNVFSRLEGKGEKVRNK